MCSSSEQTVIHVHNQTSCSSNSGNTAPIEPVTPPSNELPPVESMTDEEVIAAIPTFILSKLNRLQTGINFYDRLAAETASLDFTWMTDIIREIADKPEPGQEEGDDPEMVVTRIAAKYIQEREEENRELEILQKEVARKIAHSNEKLASQLEALQVARTRIKLQDEELEEDEGKMA